MLFLILLPLRSNLVSVLGLIQASPWVRLLYAVEISKDACLLVHLARTGAELVCAACFGQGEQDHTKNLIVGA